MLLSPRTPGGIARRYAALCLALLAGCSASPRATSECWTQLQTDALPVPRATAWSAIADLPIAAQATSEPVLVPATDVAYRIRSTGCVQIDSLYDSLGNAWVTPPATLADYDLYCKSCPQRVSLGVQSGLYVLPSSDPQPPSTAGLFLRAALRDCGTLLPSSSPGQVRIEVSQRTRPRDGQPGNVQAEIVITQGSIFFDHPDALPPAVEQAIALVNSWLAPGQLSLRIVRARRLTGEDPLRIERGEHSALVRLHSAMHACDPDGRSPDDTWVPIVFAGCLSVANTVTQRKSEPEGLTPGIPSGLPGVGAAHGVYIKGRGCDASSPMIDWTAESLARVLGHELGHYLGVYHSVEVDGGTDALDDTRGDDLMHARPSSIANPRFTAGQLRVMRQHPALMWQ